MCGRVAKDEGCLGFANWVRYVPIFSWDLGVVAFLSISIPYVKISCLLRFTIDGSWVLCYLCQMCAGSLRWRSNSSHLHAWGLDCDARPTCSMPSIIAPLFLTLHQCWQYTLVWLGTVLKCQKTCRLYQLSFSSFLYFHDCCGKDPVVASFCSCIQLWLQIIRNCGTAHRVQPLFKLI